MVWRSTWLFACALVACSSAAALQGPGGQCFLVSDCKPDLVCITQPDQTRRCTNNLGGIVSTEDAGAAVTPPMRDSGPTADVAAYPSPGDVGSSLDSAASGDDGSAGDSAGSGDDGSPGDDASAGDSAGSGDDGSPGDDADDGSVQE